MLEPLYLPDDFFTSTALKFVMSMVVKVLGVWRPRERINFISYFLIKIKLLRYSLLFELLNFAKVVTNFWWWLYLSILLGNRLSVGYLG